MIDRIAKLLNKAERATTPEEAQIYFDKAQALATAYSISLAKARLHAPPHVRVDPINKTLRIGAARKHINRHLVMLMHGIARANDLKMDIAHNSTYVILYGFPSDIAAAEELWTRISTQMIRFGEAFLSSDSWRGEQRYVHGRGRVERAQMTKQSARSSYYESFIETVGQRIQVARDEAVRQRSSRDEDQPAAAKAATSTAVAMRAKEVAVTDFYRHTSSARGSWRGSQSSSTPSASARAAGQRDGRRASLTDPGELTGRRRALRR